MSPLPFRRFNFRLQDAENSIICWNRGKPAHCADPRATDQREATTAQLCQAMRFSHFLSVLRDICLPDAVLEKGPPAGSVFLIIGRTLLGSGFII
jgi:hypothetical protein